MAARNTRFPGRAPSHPGAVLREIVLPAAALPVAVAARRLRISRQTLHKLLAEKIAVTPAMALRLSRMLGSTPDFWLRMQSAHDLWHERRVLAADLAAIEPIERAA